MIKDYFNLPLRRILKEKLQSVISLAGMALAMTCCILLILYIRYELSYDNFHENTGNIYRVVSKQSEEYSYMGNTIFVLTPGLLKEALVNDIPEIEISSKCWRQPHTLEYNSALFTETGFMYADKDFLKLFNFKVLSGDPSEALKEPFALFITERMALKYFGKDDPVGKVIKADNNYLFTVAGILEDIPENSHFSFDFLTGFETLYRMRGGREMVERWTDFSYSTYIRISENTTPEIIQDQINKLPARYLPQDPIFKEMKWVLQPLKKIHLGGNANFELTKNSDIRYIYLVTSIGLFILLIACFNYMNIATARFYSRGREIGILKVAGSSRSMLVFQLLSESVLLAAGGFIIALVVVWFILPLFADFTDRPLTYRMIFDYSMLIRILLLILITGVFAGIYPALRLSSFSPLNLIKEEHTSPGRIWGKGFLKSILIVIQYVISIVALVATFTVIRQLSFIKNADLGFISENVITISLDDPAIRKNPGILISELRKNPEVTDVTASSNLPYMISSAGLGRWEGRKEGPDLTVFRAGIDTGFIDFYDIKILSGRGFSAEFGADALNSCILNQTAAKAIGWDDATGKKFGFSHENLLNVIGEVQDFNFHSLNLPVDPLVLFLMPCAEFSQPSYISVKVSSNDILGSKSSVEKTVKELSPHYLNPVSILDDKINEMYSSDRNLASIILFSTIVAVILTCLGQYSLSFFTTKKRSREMALRKVNGAQPVAIMLMMAGEVIKLILAAVLFACPVSYLLMNKWLQNFAFRVDQGIVVFIYSLLITIVISFAAVSWHVLKLARENPAEVIRYE
jgi:putative ABC transport system permease protein